MSTDLLNTIRNDHKELSSLPQTLAEVLRVARDEDSSVADMANVLMKDPGLTTRLLRVVNSPFYGASREVTTVSQAVSRLGLRVVTSLTMSASVYDITGKWQSGLDRRRFWRHSLEVAVACRGIADAAGYNCPEEAFVVGLIHDIGLLALEGSFPDQFQSVWDKAESGMSLFELEQEAFGSDHARVGQFILKQWQLPEDLSHAVGSYRDWLGRETPEDRHLLPAILALGVMISRFTYSSPHSTQLDNCGCRERLCERLGLLPDRLAEIEQDLFTTVTEEAKFLEIDIGSPADLLSEANEQMYKQYLTVERLLRENQEMQQQIARHEMEKVAIRNLRTITATFSHYINNATATILGRAQLIEAGIESGAVKDPSGSVGTAMQVIVNAVSTIGTFMDEISSLSEFETTTYHDETEIIDIDEQVKERLKNIRLKLEMPATESEPTV